MTGKGKSGQNCRTMFGLDRLFGNLISRSMASVQTPTYAQRAAKHRNPAAKLLLETIERKKSNLAVSVDVTKSEDFLAIIDAVGPLVCLIKVLKYTVSPRSAQTNITQDTH